MQGEQIVATVRQEPRCHGIDRSRWRCRDLREVCECLTSYSTSGIAKALHRLKLRLKRGRLRLHSPDPDYAAKKAAIDRALALARTYPRRVTLIYGDEAGCYRQPTLGACWFPHGEEPTAPQSTRSNTRYRLGGGLDAVTGRVTYVAGSVVGVDKLIQLLRKLRATYPDRYLFVVWDNWPVHQHADVLAEAQRLRIRILWLPTYAPWLNPIEKLWRQLKQTELHHHRLADRWDDLKRRIIGFLDQFAHGSDALLRYVGLWSD